MDRELPAHMHTKRFTNEKINGSNNNTQKTKTQNQMQTNAHQRQTTNKNITKIGHTHDTHIRSQAHIYTNII